MGSDNSSPQRRRWWWSWPGTVVLLSFAGMLCCTFLLLGKNLTTHHKTGRVNTLVVYILSNSNPQSIQNFKYFVREGILAEDEDTDYIVLVQGNAAELELPTLPPNSRYVKHATPCFDLGMIGWLLTASGEVDMDEYGYLVWVNSSVRGPFLPAYLVGRVAWHRLLTEQLSGEIKLVGPTISCSKTSHPDFGHYGQPHVQTYAAATDRVGVDLLLEAGQVMTCHSTWQDTVLYGEIGASKAILDAGYNIASLMLRYVNADWRNKQNWDCNAEQNPLNVDSYDGLNITPLEGMFVKVMQSMVETGWPSVKMAMKYDEWSAVNSAGSSGQGSKLASNEYLEMLEQRLQTLRTKGMVCFDAEFYRAGSPNEFATFSAEQLWNHFLGHGFKEGRPYRLAKSCRRQRISIVTTQEGSNATVLLGLVKGAEGVTANTTQPS